ncbi:DeoR/GlpR family DNA-binding transcription regulator [Xylocopilactobacillus apicola]|nr:DeoR/GlpR family DNA-binding transcription regulator [Xylocopilactobacillus apicola]
MLKKERQNLILQAINIKKHVTTAELVEQFHFSEDTIRRDLRELDQKSLIKRVYNGASRIGPAVTGFEQRLSVKTDEKKLLAQAALSFLVEDTVILIDGSTTNYYLVQAIPENFAATFITNSPYLAIQLSSKKNVNVITLGGIFAKRAAVSLGIEAIDAISTFRVNTYVMGIHNLDAENGATFHSQQEAQVKQKMVARSDNVIALSTSDKLGIYSNYVCCAASEINQLITDAHDEQLLQDLKSQKIEITQV